MGLYTKVAMRLFGQYSEIIIPFFSDLKVDLKKARVRISIQEYISNAMFISLLVFMFELPLLSFIFALIFGSFLFGFISAFTVSVLLTIGFFFAFINYPKVKFRERAKEIDNNLPFASLYLSTIAGSKLPLHKTIGIFSKFSKYGKLTEEISMITSDIDAFGLDVNTSLERTIERTPSKDLKELLWGVLSINRSGGDINIFLREKAKSLVDQHRRKVFEFSHQLTIFIEVYITAVILGAVFFTILTSIMSGIAGASENIVIIQFLLIFIFLPLISAAFIIMIKAMTPGGE